MSLKSRSHPDVPCIYPRGHLTTLLFLDHASPLFLPALSPMPPKLIITTKKKADQSNIRPTRSSNLTLTPPLTNIPRKKKRPRSPPGPSSPTSRSSSSTNRHATRIAHGPRSASRGNAPSHTIVSEEEEYSESEDDEYKQESDQAHSPVSSPPPVPNTLRISVPSNEEIHNRLDQEDQFGNPSGESALNTRNDLDEDSSDDQGSETSDELPEFAEITLHFRRGDKPVEDPVTGKVRSPRKLHDWPSSKFIYHRGTGFLVFLAHINGAIDKLKEVKRPRYALLEWSATNTPYIQPSHSSKQLKYPLLTPDNFETKVARAYHTEKSRLQGTSNPVTVNVFVYLKDTNPNEGKTIVRPSQLGIEEANRQKNETRRAGTLNVGHIEQTLFARDIASLTSLAPDQPIPPPPNNHLYNQARQLDRQLAERRESSAPVSQERRDTVTIQVLLNGHWIPYSIDIAGIRESLGYDLTRIGKGLEIPILPQYSRQR